MRFLGTLLLLGGYALVYAAVAAGGKFATEPWLGFVEDAYSVNAAPTTAQGGAASSPAPPSQSSTRNFTRNRTPGLGPVSAPPLGGVGRRNTP